MMVGREARPVGNHWSRGFAVLFIMCNSRLCIISPGNPDSLQYKASVFINSFSLFKVTCFNAVTQTNGPNRLKEDVQHLATNIEGPKIPQELVWTSVDNVNIQVFVFPITSYTRIKNSG